jgi:hypothetical protein
MMFISLISLLDNFNVDLIFNLLFAYSIQIFAVSHRNSIKFIRKAVNIELRFLKRCEISLGVSCLLS